MTTIQERPIQPPAVNVGKNYRALLGWVVGLLLFVSWLMGLYVYSWIIAPTNQLAEGEFIQTEVDFSLIPRLPDSLAAQYQALKDGQLAELEGSDVMNRRMDIARIPIGQAMDLMLGAGQFPVYEDGAEEGAAEESSD